MSTKTVGAQMDEDTDLYQEFDEFADEYQSQSEAVRAALRRGIEESPTGSDSTSRLGELAGWGALAFALGVFALGQSFLAGISALTAAAVFIGVAGYRWREQ